MSIAKPFTFVAGQKARANEVNADFDTLYTQVNINISDIAQLDRDIDTISSTKANITGNASKPFAVANPVNSTDAVNKQTFKRNIGNVIDLIEGFKITIDTAQPNNRILIDKGSAYDDTREYMLSTSGVLSKENLNQAPNGTYYVYVIGLPQATSTDILISTSSTTPPLPSDYTLFRQIGKFTTNNTNDISSVISYGIIPDASIYNPTKAEMVPLVDWDLMMLRAGVTDINRIKNKYNTYTGIRGYGGDNTLLHRGDVYLKEDFTNFPRIMVVSSDDGCNYIETTILDTWELDWILQQGGLGTTKSMRTNIVKTEGRYWRIYGYDYQQTISGGVFNTTKKYFFTGNGTNQNGVIIEIYGLNN